MRALPGEAHTVLPASPSRRAVTEVGRASQRRFVMHGLVEVDVTQARRRIEAHRARTGERPSFTAFLTACVARAVAQDRTLQALRDWRGRFVVFDDVDVGLLLEVESEGRAHPLAHVVRAADKRSVREIHEEVRRAQTRPAGTTGGRALRWGARLPAVFARLFVAFVEASPTRAKRVKGTIGVSAVGMFGRRGGWGFGPVSHPLVVIVGGIATKPAVVDGRVEPREMLSLTLSFDHEVTDGAPAARFAERLARLVESAWGLEEAP